MVRIKPRHKRRTFWTMVVFAALLGIFALIMPTITNLNHMRGRIESAISAETGMPIKIDGDITFGLLGKTTIIAHNVSFPYGTVKTVSMKIPFSGLFDIKNTKLNGPVSVSGANVKIRSLGGGDLKYDVAVHDSVIHFMGKDYSIIDGTFSRGTFTGLIRTGQHKYEINFHDRDFTIVNKNVDLNIAGTLYSSGAASGTLEIQTDKINSWFEFDVPKIDKPVKLVTDFWWDGEYGFKFNNIVANNVRGNIEIASNGRRTISLYSDDTDFDFSFLAHPVKVLHNTSLSLDFYGDLTFENKNFHHMKLDLVGTEQYIQIDKIVADNTSFTGGIIDTNGAHDIMIKTTFDGRPTECLFSGTPKQWGCAKFTYGDITGFIEKGKNGVIGRIQSDAPASASELQSYIKLLNNPHMDIQFKFKNIGGRYISNGKETKTEYSYVYGKNLKWLNPHMHLLPGFMMQETGNMIWNGDTMNFIPRSNRWALTVQNNFFLLTGDDFQDLLPNMDLRSLNHIPYTASGYYNDQGDISNLTIKIANHVFTGTADSNGITLNTDILELGAFLNPEYFANSEEMEFVSNAPILLPFELNKNVYLNANTLIYDESIYKNFVYSLKAETQTFSITDNARGNLLATIIKERANYEIFMQLNRFAINGKLLSANYPLNIMDTSITAEVNLKTSGHIAHDIWYNMSGDVDLTFDGGYIVGLGLDNFYAMADKLNRLNVETELMRALESGFSYIKTMRVIGKYDNGNFATTQPIALSLRHADATGAMTIENGAMTTRFDILMRATAPEPVNISVLVAPNGRRGYSMSEIMRYFDPAFMRSFIKTHDKF